jgi:galactofuranose transport system ATP-binding protein
MSGDRPGDELLTATGMTKRFSGVIALDRVDLALAAGEARGLIGENGAGKSTLISLLTGALAADAGELRLRGRPVAFQRPVDALRAGIAAVYQQNWLIPNLTVAQNIELGRETARTALRVLSRRVQDQTINALDLVGGVPLADRPVASLSLAQRQLVAVARAYSRGSRLIIFDEPTASLSPAETELLATVIARLRQAGIALLYVTHRLDELPRVTDTVTVLRAGRVVGERPSSTPEGRLVDLMAGNEAVARESRIADRRHRTAGHRTAGHAAAGPAAGPGAGREALTLRGRGLSDPAGRFRDVDIDVRPGEIVAVVGLQDSGAPELVQVLAGARRADQGTLELGGRPLRLRSPAQAIRRGVSYMAGDRKVKGIAPNATVEETVTVSALRRVSTLGVIRSRAEQRLVAELLRACRVTAARQDMPVTALSGGNQQKTLLARTLATQPKLIICEDPTSGVDPPGRDSLYELLADAVERGASVVLSSSDLREVTILADRALVLWRGHAVAELSGAELTQANLMRAQFAQYTVGRTT